MRQKLDPTKCSRCQEAAPTINIRNENFCDACFVYFINYKFRQPLNAFKANYQSTDLPLLVVLVDFELRSACLVKLLEETLTYQRLRHNRVGFNLKCYYIGDEDHQWDFNTEVERIPTSNLTAKYLVDGNAYNKASDLSRSSQHDLDLWVKRDAIRSLAPEGSTILFDYSMSFLSELVLAETCKGRGALIPELLLPQNAIYPLRDILDSELEIYARVMQLEYAPGPKAPRVSRMQSIDELVHEFVVDTRREFPAVDATVARTGGKLARNTTKCRLCTGDGDELCYGCERMLEGRKSAHKLDILREFEL